MPRRAYNQTYYKENKSKINKQNSQWYEDNKESARKWQNEYYREYYKKNKEAKLKQHREYLKGRALFVTYAPQIEAVEEVRDNNGTLETTCTYCGKWFSPTVQQVQARVKALNNILGHELRLYCSNGCKKECSIYYQKKYPKRFKKDSSREVQPELRQMVFKRDDYVCQICGSTESIHCHHLIGVEQNPIESADLDNCITLCKKCHKWVHSLEGCTTYDLRCQKYGEAL